MDLALIKYRPSGGSPPGFIGIRKARPSPAFCPSGLKLLCTCLLVLLIWAGPALAQSTVRGPVVFLGDSLTAGADWAGLFPRVHTINLGVSGNKTGDILVRLGQVYERQPGRIFLMAGINDLGAGVRVPDIVDHYRLIIEHLVRRMPGVKIYIQSVLPVNNSLFSGSIHNRKVMELNHRLESLAVKLGLVYLDLFPSFIDQAGQLRSDFTRDGVHLNQAGYRVWRSRLADILE